MRSRVRQVAWVALGVALFSAPAEAQDRAPYTDPVYVPPVVVTPERSGRSSLEVGRSVNTVDGEQRREQQSRSVPELLDETTGVAVQRTNRGSGAPIIRGLIGPQNLIVVDGVRFNNATFRTGPNQYLALFDSRAVERLEVVRGPSSVLYGNGAMGGVLHILSDSAQLGSGAWEPEAEIEGRFASADLSGGGSAVFRGAVGDFAFLVGGSYDYFGPLRVGGGDEVPLSDYQAGYWRARLRYEPSDWAVTAGYLGTALRGAGRTDKLGRGETRTYDNDDHLAWARFEWRRGVLERLRATVSYHRMGEHVERYECETSDDKTVTDLGRCAAQDPVVVTRQRRNDDRMDTVGADLEALLSLLDGDITIASGLDLYFDDVSSEREDAKREGGFVFSPASRGNFSEGSTYLTLGAYLHAAATVLEVRTSAERSVQLRLSGGMRFSHFAASAPDVPGVGDVEYAFRGMVGSAGVQLLMPGVFDVYWAFVQGFRAPNLQETTVLGNTGSKFELPNAELRPERSDTFELGAKLRLGPVDVAAAWFYSFLQDAIDEEPAVYEGQSEINGTPVVRRVNTAKGTVQGVEADLGVRVWRFRVSAGVAWTTAELTDGDGATTPARRIPPVFGNARLRYTHPTHGAYAELSVRWAARQDELHPSDARDLRICETFTHSGVLRSPCDGTPGYAVLGVRGGWQVLDALRVDLSLQNPLDTSYRVHGSGQDGPGVDGRVTVTANF